MKVLKNIVKYGKSPKGKQKYYNKEEGRFFTENPEKRYTQTTKIQAVTLYTDGMGIRAIARFLGTSHVSVQNWIKNAAHSLPKPESEQPKPTDIQWVQLDEMWHYLKKKQKNSGSGLH